MELAIKWLLTQGPSVVILATMWWFSRKDGLNEITRLQERIAQKDEQLLEYIQGMNTLSRAIDKLTERLR